MPYVRIGWRFLLRRMAALIFCAIGLVIGGCVSAPEIYPPDQVPSDVRLIKTIRLYAYEIKKDTAIDLKEGELVSVLVEGKIRRWQGAPAQGPEESTIFKWIGDEKTLLFGCLKGGTFKSPTSGRLYFGINDSFHNDNFGFHDMAVVVWTTDDYTRIVSFLKELQQRSPKHEGVSEAIRLANSQIALENEIKQTSQQIESTKGQIQELSRESQQLPDPVAATKRQRLLELEKRLSELTAKMAQLDAVKLQLQEERAKSDHFSKEITEKELREQQLMTKLGEGVKVPPLLLITSPEDRRQNETDSVLLTGAAEDDQGLMRLDVFI